MGEAHREELVGVIREVRNRWRLKLAVRGALVVVAGSLLAFLLSARGLEAFRFSTSSIVTFRILIFAIFAALAGFWLVRPLRRRVSDSQVALYLEEFDPSLEAALLSAVEATSADTTDPSHSPALVERLVADAIEKCRAAEHNRRIERAAMLRHLMTMGALALVAALVVSFGPAYFRHGLSALFKLSQSAKAASPYHIEVAPGDATVPRGSDQTITATVSGFTANGAELLMRSSSAGDFERVPLVATSKADTFEGILFHLDQPVDYYVEAMGVRSDSFRMSLVDLPAVQQLDLDTAFPPTPASSRRRWRTAATWRRSRARTSRSRSRRR